MGVLKSAYGVRSSLELLSYVALATGAAFLSLILLDRRRRGASMR